MSEIEEWLADASVTLGLAIRKLPADEANSVYRQAQAQYVVGNPRVWWLALKGPCDHYDSSSTSLRDVLPDRNGAVLLIPETDDTPLVYEIDAAHLDAILDECPLFEYNVVHPSLRWLVAESDHNVFFVCRQV